MKKLMMVGAVGALSLVLFGCSGMSKETKGTLIGAGVGGAAGGLITQSAAGAAIGAAAGGVVGNVASRN